MKFKTLHLNKKTVSLLVISFFLLSCFASIIPQAKAVDAGSGSINQISSTYAWWPDSGAGTNTHLTSYAGRACWSVTQPSTTSAIDAGGYSVVAGDRIVFVSQIQTSPTSDGTTWGVIGTDFVGTNLTEYLSPSRGAADIGMTTNGNDNIESDYHSINPQQVYGGTTTWTQKYQDSIVQTSYLVNQPTSGDPSQTGLYPYGTSFPIGGIQVWLMAWGQAQLSSVITAYFSNIGLFIIPIGDPAYSEPVSYFEAIAATTSPGTSPTPTPIPAPIAQSLTNEVSGPTSTLATFLIFNAVLFALAMIAYFISAKLGIFFGIIGLVGVVFFMNAGELIISSSTNPTTLLTTTDQMPIGWLLVVPIVLCMLNFGMILITPKIDASRRNN